MREKTYATLMNYPLTKVEGMVNGWGGGSDSGYALAQGFLCKRLAHLWREAAKRSAAA